MSSIDLKSSIILEKSFSSMLLKIHKESKKPISIAIDFEDDDFLKKLYSGLAEAYTDVIKEQNPELTKKEVKTLAEFYVANYVVNDPIKWVETRNEELNIFIKILRKSEITKKLLNHMKKFAI